jgi:chromosome segregation ATPase
LTLNVVAVQTSLESLTEIVHQQKEKASETEQTNQALQQELDLSRSHDSEISKELESKNDEMAALQEEYEVLMRARNSERDELEAKVAEVSKQLEQQSTEVLELRRQVAALQEELSGLAKRHEEEIQNSALELDSTKKLVIDNERRFQNQFAELANTYEKEIEEYEQKLAGILDNAEEVNKDRKIFKELTKQYISLSDTLEADVVRLEERERALLCDLNFFKQLSKQQKKVAEAEQEKLEVAQRRLGEVKGSLRASEEEAARTSAELEASKGQEAKVRAEMSEIYKNLEELRAEAVVLNERLENEKAGRIESEKKNEIEAAQAREALETMRQDMEDLSRDYERSCTELETTRENLETVAIEFTNLEGSYQALSGAAEEACQKYEETCSQIGELRGELEVVAAERDEACLKYEEILTKISEIRSELEVAISERDEARSQFSRLQGELQVAISERDEAQSQISGLRGEIEVVISEKDEVRSQISGLRGELEVAATEREEARSKHLQACEVIAALQLEMTEMRNSAEIVPAGTPNQEEEVEKLQEALVASREAERILSEKYQAASEEISGLKFEIDEVSSSALHFQEAYERVQGDLASSNERDQAISDALLSLQSSFDEARVEAEKYKQAYSDVQAAIEAGREEAAGEEKGITGGPISSELVAEIEELKRRLEETAEEEEKAEEERGSRRAEVEKLSAQVVTLSSELSEARAKISAAARISEHATSGTEFDLSGKFSRLEDEKKSAEGEALHYKTLNAQGEEQLSELMKRMTEAQMEASNLACKLSSAQEEIVGLKEELAESLGIQISKAEFISRENLLKSEIRELRNESVRAEQRLTSALEMISALESRDYETKQELREKDERIAELTREVAGKEEQGDSRELRQTLTRMKHEASINEREMNRLRGLIQNREVALHNVKEELARTQETCEASITIADEISQKNSEISALRAQMRYAALVRLRSGRGGTQRNRNVRVTEFFFKFVCARLIFNFFVRDSFFQEITNVEHGPERKIK